MKTIAQQLNITAFPFEIKDSNGKEIYYENSIGFWYKRKYDSNGKEIYFEDFNGYWEKREWDSNGNVIYYENSYGTIFDKRPKKELISLAFQSNNLRLKKDNVMKTIAQQLNVTEFPFKIKDSNGKEIYFENSDGFWSKGEYDSNGNGIYFEDSDGYWSKREYDSNGNEIYCEDPDGYCHGRAWDSNGVLLDNRPKKELTMNEIADKFGIPVSELKIKKD